MLSIKVIHNDEEHAAAIKEVERLWGAKAGTEDGDRFELLTVLVDAYEDERWPIEALDPITTLIETLKFRGLTRKDLEPALGSRAKVSEVLSGKRALSTAMLRKLAEPPFSIPPELLLGPPPEPKKTKATRPAKRAARKTVKAKTAARRVSR